MRCPRCSKSSGTTVEIEDKDFDPGEGCMNRICLHCGELWVVSEQQWKSMLYGMVEDVRRERERRNN